LLLGADPDTLDEIARQFDGAVAALNQVYQMGHHAAHSNAWSGPDAERFRHQWDGTARTRLVDAERMLVVAAKTLRLNATAQRRTSERASGTWGTSTYVSSGVGARHVDLGDHSKDLARRGVVPIDPADAGSAVRTDIDSLEQHEAPANQAGDYMHKLMALKDGTLEIVTLPGPPPRYVVLLKGVDGASPLGDGHQTDIPNAVLEKETGHSAWSEGVKAAMRATIPPGSNVMFMGHSGGGIVAADLANDRGFNGPGGYHVTDVVVAGSGVFDRMPFMPSGTNVLMLQHASDQVANAIVGAGIVGAVVPGNAEMTGAGLVSHANHVSDVFTDTSPVDEHWYGAGGHISGHDPQYYEHELRNPQSEGARTLVDDIDSRYASGAPATSAYFRLDDPSGWPAKVGL